MALEHAQPGAVVNLKSPDPSLNSSKSIAIVKRDRFEAVQLIVPSGSSIPVHQVSGYLTLQCLRGRVILDAGEETELSEGDWVYLDRNAPHSLSGLEDAVLLLTILFD